VSRASGLRKSSIEKRRKGLIKEVPLNELLRNVHGEVRASVLELLNQPGAEGVILFRNLQMDSSHLGEESFVAFGPGLSVVTIAQAEGKHLNDLPSLRQYPVEFARKV
jgi:hypothetical protein